MNLPFPTRNDARALIVEIVDLSEKAGLGYSTSKVELAAFASLWYSRKSPDFIDMTLMFVLTNALIDMFSDMRVENEDQVNYKRMANQRLSLLEIEQYFQKKIGVSLDKVVSTVTLVNNRYNIKMSEDGAGSFNTEWFNNSNRFIPPLLNSYKEFKDNKGMQFLRDDVLQIPIDYSIALCNNHYVQVGFLNRKVCLTIFSMLMNTTLECYNLNNIDRDNLFSIVMRDLSKPKNINSAIEFIKQL